MDSMSDSQRAKLVKVLTALTQDKTHTLIDDILHVISHTEDLPQPLRDYEKLYMLPDQDRKKKCMLPTALCSTTDFFVVVGNACWRFTKEQLCRPGSIFADESYLHRCWAFPDRDPKNFQLLRDVLVHGLDTSSMDSESRDIIRNEALFFGFYHLLMPRMCKGISDLKSVIHKVNFSSFDGVDFDRRIVGNAADDLTFESSWDDERPEIRFDFARSRVIPSSIRISFPNFRKRKPIYLRNVTFNKFDLTVEGSTDDATVHKLAETSTTGHSDLVVSIPTQPVAFQSITLKFGECHLILKAIELKGFAVAVL